MTTENAMADLCRLMNIPDGVEAVVKTSDGHYVARLVGELGYPHYIGTPRRPHFGPGRTYMLAYWRALPPERKEAVLALTANPPDGVPINLAQEFGVPVLEPAEV